ncbi:MAG: TonB-dependent receptor [Acidobacteriia bacterium]|nr:TonB-dependent receptor [Terriglobia bacterium]
MKSFHRNVLASFCLLFALFAIAVMPASAQVQNGIFTGTVMDPQGAAVVSADVSITNVGTNATTDVKTNAEGLYRATEMPVGTYKITVSAAGFKKSAKSGLYLGAGLIARVDFTLELGAQTETVTVEAGAVMVQTEDSRLSTTIGASQVSNLPLNGRNVFDLITLAPGAVDATGVSFENGHSTVVNGLRPNFNGFMINGSSDKGLSGGVNTTPNADMVQEIQELTLNMSAQYGNSAGAGVNVVTKSGSNDLHGSAYEFLRNDKLDANDFFRNASPDPEVNGKPSKLRYNQFGVTATGPIWKDHLFFTASYQGDRFTTAAAPIPVISETPEWRAAVISALPNSVAATIYQNFPTTSAGNYGGPDSTTVAGYVGNFGPMMCPANFPAGFTNLPTGSFPYMFGITAAEQTWLTGQHQTGVDINNNPIYADNCSTYGYNGTPPPLQAGAIDRNTPFLNDNVVLFGSQSQGNLFNGNEWSTRIDWLRKNDRVFGEYLWVHSSDSFGPVNASSSIHGFRNPQTIHSPNLQLSWVHTFSPNWINEARAGYSLGRNDLTTATPGVPAIGFDDGTAGFGSYNGYPQFFHENIYTYGDMMSFQRGKHSIKVGVDFRRNIENSEFNVARPSYYFFDQIYFAAQAPYGMAAGVDPGFVSNQPAQLASNIRHWRNLEMGAFIQDDWKVSRKLTINVGLRYDLYTRHTEKDGKVTTFIPGPGCLTPANGYCADWISNANIPAGQAGCDTATQLARNVLAGVCGPGGFAVASSLGGADHNNFGPRAGFAYDPWGNGKTAFRGGFGVSYEGTLYNPLSNSRWNPPFYSFNGVNNALGGDVNAVVFGPTAACDGVTVTAFCPAGSIAGVAACDPVTTACAPSGAPVTFTGAGANPGIGQGSQAAGNIQGYNAWNSNFANLTGIVFPQGIRDPYVLNYYFGIQREILPKTTLEVNYVGTQGHKLFRAEQANRLPGIRLPAGTTAVDQFGRTLTGLGSRFLNPNYGRLRVWENVSKSWYSGLQVAVRHQVTRGFAFNLNYAWSHSIDTGSDWHSGATSANGAAAGDGYSLDPTKPMLDKGNSTFDVRHRLSFNYVYEIPYMKEQKGFAGHLLGGWQYQGIWAFQSGAHFTPYCASGNACDFNYDGERNDRPNVGPGGSSMSVSREQWANGWFNVPGSPYSCGWYSLGAVQGADGTCSSGGVAFFGTPCRACDGNLGRNTFTGPGIFNTDQSLFKNIRITERFNMQFRFEVFNALNRANFKLPSSSTGANFANRITAFNFGQSAGEMTPRLMQFALKLLW